ncbi:MAG: hypothetical protein U5K72_08540 [Balneolaceae bacterium]|nr:hypothetical protein [Balneolaceae bacterium]
MEQKKVIKLLLSAIVILFLTIFAWWAIEGSIRQWTHSDTFGQQIETVVQFCSGILSFLMIGTLFCWQDSARLIRLAWIISFIGTAALSALVWGPPMPLVSLAFASVSFLLGWTILMMIRKIEKLN